MCPVLSDACNDNLPSESSVKFAHTVIYILTEKFSNSEVKYYEPLERLCLKFPHLTFLALNVIEDHELNKNETAIKAILKILEHAIGNGEDFAMIQFPEYICKLEQIIKREDEITRLWNLYIKKLLEQVKNQNRNAKGIYGILILDKETFGNVKFFKNLKKEVGAKYALESLVNCNHPIHPILKVSLLRMLGLYLLDLFDENAASSRNSTSSSIDDNLKRVTESLDYDLIQMEVILSAAQNDNYTKKIAQPYPTRKLTKISLIVNVNDRLINFYTDIKKQEDSLYQFLSEKTLSNEGSKSKFIEHFCQSNMQKDFDYQHRLLSLVLLWRGLTELVLNVDSKLYSCDYANIRRYFILNLARAYSALGCCHEAIECYEEVAKVDDQESFYLLGLLLLFIKAHVKKDSTSLCRSIEYLKSAIDNDKDCKTLYKNIMDKVIEKKTNDDYKWLKNTIYEQLKEEYLQFKQSLKDNEKAE